MPTPPVSYLTSEQYLEIERAAEFRSEYCDGKMYAMAGGSRNHSWIASNTLTHLNEQLRGKPCGGAGGDIRIYSEELEIYTYPDIVVTCADRFLDSHRDTLTDATLVVEVLSPSTSNYDKGEKFEFYRTLPSFAEYLLLSQFAFHAEHHVRQPDNSWLMRVYQSPDDEIPLNAIGCKLLLGSLYDRVVFEPREAANDKSVRFRSR